MKEDRDTPRSWELESMEKRGKKIARRYLLDQGLIDKGKMKKWAKEIGFLVKLVAVIPSETITYREDFREWVKQEYGARYDVLHYHNDFAIVRKVSEEHTS